MKPIITKHYGLGLLVGFGVGFFLASILNDPGVMTGDWARLLMKLVGLVAMIVGQILYFLSLRTSHAKG